MTRHSDDGSNRNVVTGNLKYLYRGEHRGPLVAGANLLRRPATQGTNKSLKTHALAFAGVLRSRSPIVIRQGSEVENSDSEEGDSVMQARMKNPAMIVPGAMEALQNLAKASEQGGVPKKTLDLVHLRASQINGCSVCVDMGFRFKKADETIERLFAVAAWKDAPYFTDAERAALALTESVTRLSDRSDPVPDEIWKEAARHYDESALASLVLWIATTNVWNRLNVATEQVAGEWAKSEEARGWRNKQVAAD